MIQLKFVVQDFHPHIRLLKCVKETAKFVWLDGYYFKGSSSQKAKGNDVFDSWQDAKDELIRRADDRLTTARRQLEAAQEFASNMKRLKPPAKTRTLLLEGGESNG